MMGKRLRKLGMRREEDRGSCMWNFVSKLHSRSRGSSRKLLLGNKTCTEAAAGYGISRTEPNLMTGNEVSVKYGERTESMAKGGKPSVKTLMEEEMISEEDAEWIHTLKRGKQSCDLVTDDDHASSCYRTGEQGLIDDAKDVVEYLGNLLQQGSGIWEEHGVHGEEEEFSGALRRAVSRQLINRRQLSEDEVLCCSKVLMSMLRILSSTEFSLLGLLQDPEAMLTKCMEILREIQLGRSSSKRSAANSVSSRKEEGDRFEMNVGSPLVPSRIVILKPWTTELPKPAKSLKPSLSLGTESIDTKGKKKKSGAPGFFNDIKRKLRNIVAKEYVDEYNDRISRKSRKGHVERSSEKKPSGKDSKDEAARFSVLANKYLSEAITVDDEDMTSSSSRDPHTMGTILLNPELNCSLPMSPGRRWEYGAAMGYSRTISPIVSDKRRKPVLMPVAETETYAFKFLAENIPPSSVNGDGAGNKVVRDATEESSLSIASSSEGLLILKKGDEDLEIAINLPGRPSPVSVLEPQHFSDEDMSPAIFERGMHARDFYLSAEVRRQQLEAEPEEDDDIHVDEADAHGGTFKWDSGLVLDRVADLIQASYSTWEDLYLKSQSSDQQLEPSVHERRLFQHNAKLLIDCVNEVLSEACAHFIGRSCLSLSGQRIKLAQNTGFIIREVCHGVKRHLEPLPHPRSLEQIIGKDMSRTGQWMDLTFEDESIGFELGDAICSELLDEVTNDDIAMLHRNSDHPSKN